MSLDLCHSCLNVWSRYSSTCFLSMGLPFVYLLLWDCIQDAMNGVI